MSTDRSATPSRSRVLRAARGLAWVLVIAGGLTLAILLVLRGLEIASRSDARTEVLVYGIDGADWAVIDRLIARGELPHLAGLIDRGVRANLRTIRPMLSPRIWTTIASGKLPEKHGVKDFFATSAALRSSRLWDIAEAAGWTVGVYGYPITWPPHPVAGGFLIPGWMAQGTETYPPEFAFVKEIEAASRDGRRIGWLDQARFGLRGFVLGLRLSTLAEAAWQAVAGSADPLERYAVLGRLQYRIQSDLFLDLHQKHRPALSIFYSDVVDKLSHRYWLFQDPQAVSPEQHGRFGDIVEDAYRQADAELGRVLATIDADTTVIVLSDHGFESADQLAVSRPSLRGDRTLALLPDASGLRAFTVTGRLYIRGADPSAVERARAALESGVHGPTGAHPFEVEPQPDGSFSVALTPELRFHDEDPISIAGKTAPLGSFTRRRILGGGVHRDPGIFILSCTVCRKGEDIYELHVTDVLPTLLHAMDLPVGRDMDGRVALDAFLPEDRDTRPVTEVATHDGALQRATADPGDGEDPDGRIEQMLRSVGYVE